MTAEPGDVPQSEYDDETFATAGGFPFTDELAREMKDRAQHVIRSDGQGVVLSALDVLWLVEGYDRARSANGGGTDG